MQTFESFCLILMILGIIHLLGGWVICGANKVYRVVTRYSDDYPPEPFWVIEAKNILFPFWYTFGSISMFNIRSYISQEDCINKLKLHLKSLHEYHVNQNTLKLERKRKEAKYLGNEEDVVNPKPKTKDYFVYLSKKE